MRQRVWPWNCSEAVFPGFGMEAKTWYRKQAAETTGRRVGTGLTTGRAAGRGWTASLCPMPARWGPGAARSHLWASASPLRHWNDGDTGRRARSPDPAPCCLKTTGRGQGFPKANTERERRTGPLLMPGGRGRVTCRTDGLCLSPPSSRLQPHSFLLLERTDTSSDRSREVQALLSDGVKREQGQQ